MARQELWVTIERPGRDQGKRYKITEMPASKAEWWATRVLKALARGNVDVPEGLFSRGWEALAVLGIRGIGGLDDIDTKALMDEMMACITIERNPGLPTFEMMESDIEEVATRFELREAWISLHLGFSIKERMSSSIAESNRQGRNGSNMSTSPGTSAS